MRKRNWSVCRRLFGAALMASSLVFAASCGNNAVESDTRKIQDVTPETQGADSGATAEENGSQGKMAENGSPENADIDSDSDAEAGAKAETDADGKTEAEDAANLKADADVDAKTDIDADSGAGVDSEKDADAFAEGENEGSESNAPEGADEAAGADAGSSSDEPESGLPITGRTGDADIAVRNNIPELSIRTEALTEYQELEDTYRLISELSYDVPALSDESAEAFPELDAVLRELANEWKKDAETNFTELTANAQEFFAEQTEYYSPLYYRHGFLLRRADSGILSLLGTYGSYTGGVHGDYGYGGYNYDCRTGEELRLDDVIADKTAMAERVIGMLYKNYDSRAFFDSMEDTVRGYFQDGAETEPSFTLEPDGITFWFNPYELAPYASGIQTVHILYGEASGLFKDRCTDGVLSNYAIELVEGIDELTDLEGDGTVDKISVHGEPDEYDSYSYANIHVEVNGSEITNESWSYSLRPVLVHANGNDVLLAQMTSDNDYQMMYLYDMTSGGPVYMGSEALSLEADVPERYGEDFSGGWRAVLTDTSHFRMGIRYDLLSTIGAERWYGIGADVVFVPETSYFEMNNDSFALTTKTELHLDQVDEERDEVFGAGVDVPAGTKLYFFRTDNESYTDMKDEEGNVYRVTLDSVEWPRTINGIELEECFDGMLFAG